jgi:hypothetical protein
VVSIIFDEKSVEIGRTADAVLKFVSSLAKIQVYYTCIPDNFACSAQIFIVLLINAFMQVWKFILITKQGARIQLIHAM